MFPKAYLAAVYTGKLVGFCETVSAERVLLKSQLWVRPFAMMEEGIKTP